MSMLTLPVESGELLEVEVLDDFEESECVNDSAAATHVLTFPAACSDHLLCLHCADDMERALRRLRGLTHLRGPLRFECTAHSVEFTARLAEIGLKPLGAAR